MVSEPAIRASSASRDRPSSPPSETVVALRDALLATLAAFLVLDLVVWDALVANLATYKLPPGLIDNHVLVMVSPFDVLVFEATVASVVGLLVGTARVGVSYWRWRRRHAALPERWMTASPLVTVFVGGLLLFVAVTLATYQLLVPRLSAAIAAETATTSPPFVWAMFALICCLACGVGALLASVSATLAIDGVASVGTVTSYGAVLVVGTLTLGYLAWPLGWIAQYAWACPILSGYIVGSVLAVTAAWLGNGSDAATSAAEDVS